MGHCDPDNPIYDVIFQERDKNKREKLHYEISREIEKQADLFVAKDPTMGENLIHFFKRNLFEIPAETPNPKDTHPTFSERINYMSKELEKKKAHHRKSKPNTAML